MDAKLDFTTLFFLVLAIIVFLKLRSVLGRRTGDENQRYEKYRAERQARASVQQDNIVKLPRHDREPVPAGADQRESAAARETRFTKFANGNEPLATGLLAVGAADPNFDPQTFMAGARSAYELIVMAFAEGNRTLLKQLLAPDVYEGFIGAIDDRESRGEKIEQSFVGISGADMLEAEVKGGQAHVTVKFVSEIISAVRSRAGDVISGDPKKIKEVTDIWTFARDTRSSDPNWPLVATQAAT